MEDVREVFVCENMREAINRQFELAKDGFDSSAYQTVSNYVIVVVKEAEHESK